ncbi:MAG TPA: toast rack family protein [Anaerolineales bacterium]|nr:toast rack family protein [Anaerolineales bacterium]
MSCKMVLIVLILALAGLACGFSVALPEAPTPGPQVTDQVTVPAGSLSPARLSILFGGGELNLIPGAQNLVEGSATYNVPDLKPEVLSDSTGIQIKQGSLQKIPYPSNLKNQWDFKLGSMPIDLTINAGAYTGTYELGGLSLTNLTIKDGASHVTLSFSQANSNEMTMFRYETGASNVRLSGLANADFSTMVFSGGAGDYTLDFSGTLKRDATVTISSGLSNIILVIPQNVNANVTAESGLANISAGASWTQSGDLYAQSGSGPTLTFLIKAGAANLTLTH